MVVTCDINFDNNPHGTYFAGQMLVGSVTLKTDEQTEVKGVSLNVSGFAYTHWTEKRKTFDDSLFETETSYSGREDYIESTTYLLCSNDSTKNIEIEPGTYVYKFTCQIPMTCPSSLEGTYGHVRYTVKVVLERSSNADESFSRCFTVLKVMDLNNQISIAVNLPVHTEVEKTFTCWTCGSKPMKFKLSLPKTGFVPGEEIPVGLLVTNDSSVPVEEIIITLAILVRYYCQNTTTDTRMERLVMAKLNGEGVMRQCTKSFLYPLRVPATPPTCFNLCRFIQIAYQVELEAKIKGWHTNEFALIPVTIGSVPLVDKKSLMEQQPINNRSELLLVAPTPSDTIASAQVAVIACDSSAPAVTQSSLTKPWSVDDNIAPPSYEEATHLSQAKTKELNFVPLYAVFNIPSSPAPNQTSVSQSSCENNNVDPDKSTWL